MTFAPAEHSLFPGFEILRMDEGAFGRVYVVRQLAPPNHVMVAKTLHPDVRSDATHYESFIREAQRMMSLPQHGSLPRAFGLDMSGTQPVLYMEYIDGRPLDAWVRETRALAPPVTWKRSAIQRWFRGWPGNGHPFGTPSLLFWMLQVCETLEWLYAHGFRAHADVHLQNVMIDRNDGRTVLVDFGLARMADGEHTRLFESARRSGKLMGNLEYLAPEVAAGENTPNPTADVFSVGAMMVQALLIAADATLGFPLGLITEDGRHDTLRRLRNEHGLPAAYEGILIRTTERDPAQRYERPSALAEPIRQLLAVHGIDVRFPPIAANPAAERGRRIAAAAAFGERHDTRGEGIRILEELLAEEPDAIAATVLADLHFRQEDFEAAYAAIHRAEAAGANDVQFLNQKGSIELALDRTAQACATLRQALEIADEANRPVVLANLALALRLAGETDEASRLLTPIAAVSGDWRVLLQYARDRYDAGDYESAEAAARRSVSLHPLETAGWRLLSATLQKQKRWDDAYAACGEGLRMAPNDGDLLIGMAFAAARLGRPINELFTLLERPAKAGREDADNFALRAAAREVLRDFAHARTNALRALELDPKHLLALATLERLVGKSGNERGDALRYIPLTEEEFGLPVEELTPLVNEVGALLSAAHEVDAPLTAEMLERFVAPIDGRKLRAVLTTLQRHYTEWNDPRGLRENALIERLLAYLEQRKQ